MGFIGRELELANLKQLLRTKIAKLLVMKGRRRIGKSRLLLEFSKKEPFDKVLIFSGVSPNEKTSAQSQRDEFAEQLASKTSLPKVVADSWNTLFQLLASQVQNGRVLILFDEI